MSKKTTASKKISAPKAKAASTPVRYTAIPKAVAVVPAARTEVSSDMIARKAFELFAAGRSGSELDHWLAAEAELRTAA